MSAHWPRRARQAPGELIAFPLGALVLGAVQGLGTLILPRVHDVLRPLVLVLGGLGAIFAVRIREGAGNPVPARSEMGTSPGQPRFSALVTIKTHRRPRGSFPLSVEATRAGLDRRAGRFV